MKYCMTTNVLVGQKGQKFALLPGQVVPAYDPVKGVWLQESIQIRRISAVIREHGRRVHVENDKGVTLSEGDPSSLEGPSFVKDLFCNSSLPLVGDATGWRSIRGKYIARWRAAKASDPEVMFWITAPPTRVLGDGQWVLPALGSVTAERQGADSQCCTLVGDARDGYFTPLIPIIPGWAGSFLDKPENQDILEAIEKQARKVLNTRNPRKLWLGWVFFGNAQGIQRSGVYLERVPGEMMPYPIGCSEWTTWWTQEGNRLTTGAVDKALAAITSVCSVDEERFVDQDREVAETILQRLPACPV